MKVLVHDGFGVWPAPHGLNRSVFPGFAFTMVLKTSPDASSLIQRDEKSFYPH
jgi:hypothetical protein